MEAIFTPFVQQLTAGNFSFIALLAASFLLLFKAGKLFSTFEQFEKRLTAIEDKTQFIEEKTNDISNTLTKVYTTVDLLYQAYFHDRKKEK